MKYDIIVIQCKYGITAGPYICFHGVHPTGKSVFKLKETSSTDFPRDRPILKSA